MSIQIILKMCDPIWKRLTMYFPCYIMTYFLGYIMVWIICNEIEIMICHLSFGWETQDHYGNGGNVVLVNVTHLWRHMALVTIATPSNINLHFRNIVHDLQDKLIYAYKRVHLWDKYIILDVELFHWYIKHSVGWWPHWVQIKGSNISHFFTIHIFNNQHLEQCMTSQTLLLIGT